MQLTVNIPDPIYNALKNIDPNIEDSIIKAVKLYTAQKSISESDPFHNWLQTPVEDRDKKTDISEKHDTYLYGFEK